VCVCVVVVVHTNVRQFCVFDASKMCVCSVIVQGNVRQCCVAVAFQKAFSSADYYYSTG
jgi:hypothetical protein